MYVQCYGDGFCMEQIWCEFLKVMSILALYIIMHVMTS